MMYNPQMGRWMTRDPSGEANSTNLYDYCDDDPVNKHDPTGLFVLNFIGTFTAAEKAKVTTSIARIDARLVVLITQLDAAVVHLRATKLDPGNLIDILTSVKTVFQNIRNWIADKTTLKIKQLSLDNHGVAAKHWKGAWLTAGMDPEIQFNLTYESHKVLMPWTAVPDAELDETLFHELTHQFDTLDDYSKGWGDNAHELGRLMSTDISKWGSYLLAKRLLKDIPVTTSTAPASKP